MTRGAIRPILIVGIFAFVILLTVIKQPSAHPGSEWYESKWSADHHTGLHITWRFSPGFPDGGDKKARVGAGFYDWNTLDQQMEFEQLADADNGYPFNCDYAHGYNGIFHYHVDGVGGTIAQTLRCVHSNGDIHNFSIRFDEGDPWWDNLGNGPNDKHDYGGAATHEVGHATGWKGHFQASWDVCSDPRHTMCELDTGRCGSDPGVTCTPYSYRSLELHDKHTFDNAYPDE